jgi:hypothetical protein
MFVLLSFKTASLRPYESDQKSPEAGRSEPVNRNTEDVHAVETVLAGLPGTTAASASHEKGWPMQPYGVEIDREISLPNHGNANNLEGWSEWCVQK